MCFRRQVRGTAASSGEHAILGAIPTATTPTAAPTSTHRSTTSPGKSTDHKAAHTARRPQWPAHAAHYNASVIANTSSSSVAAAATVRLDASDYRLEPVHQDEQPWIRWCSEQWRREREQWRANKQELSAPTLALYDQHC